MRKGFKKLENSDGDSCASEDEALPVRITYLTPALIEQARIELKETEETRIKALAEFRKRIEDESKLYTRTDDLFLLFFLRCRKFNVKKAFKLLHNFYSFRRDYDYIYVITENQPIMDAVLRNYIGFLPYRDKNGSVVFLGKCGMWDPELDSFETMFRTISAILVYSLEHEATSIAGFRVIFDARGITWKQLKYLTPTNILLMIRSTQFCFPARYKGIHVLSENKMLNFLWMMISPFLTSKLKKRIFFHGEDMTPLLQYIHPSILPVEFGGRGPQFDNAEWKEVMESRIETVKSMLNYGYKD